MNFLCKVVAVLIIGWVLLQAAPLVLLMFTVM